MAQRPQRQPHGGGGLALAVAVVDMQHGIAPFGGIIAYFPQTKNRGELLSFAPGMLNDWSHKPHTLYRWLRSFNSVHWNISYGIR